MSEAQNSIICRHCPLNGSGRTRSMSGNVEGCPGPVDVERVGVAPTLEDRGAVNEVFLEMPTLYCGRQPERVAAAIGVLTTENRIVDDSVTSAGRRSIVVASGPVKLLTRLYGSPEPGTPDPAPAASAAETPRPHLQLVGESVTMSGVHAQLLEAVRLIEAVDVHGLRNDGQSRVAQLTNGVDGTSNPNAFAMQDAASELLDDLQTAVEATAEFTSNVEQYMRSTGG